MRTQNIALIGGIAVVGLLALNYLSGKQPAAGSGRGFESFIESFIPSSENLARFLPEIGLNPISESPYQPGMETVWARAQQTATGGWGGPAMFTSPEAEEAVLRQAYFNVGIDFEKYRAGARGFESLLPGAQEKAISSYEQARQLYEKGYITPETVYAAQHPAPNIAATETSPAPAEAQDIGSSYGGAASGGSPSYAGYDWGSIGIGY